MRRHQGFSLIELLIVVSIILIIASIAIPKLLNAKLAANEASAVASVRDILTAQIGYATYYPQLGFADDLKKLGAPTSGPPTSNAAGYLDWVLACTAQPCPKSGYDFQITNTTGTVTIGTYTALAQPKVIGSTGNRTFCGDQTGNITYDPMGGSSAAACTQPLSNQALSH